jgi:hypothetical protein
VQVLWWLGTTTTTTTTGGGGVLRAIPSDIQSTWLLGIGVGGIRVGQLLYGCGDFLRSTMTHPIRIRHCYSITTAMPASLHAVGFDTDDAC